MKNTKPFDLELAKAGHPLILVGNNENTEIVSFVGITPFEGSEEILIANRTNILWISLKTLKTMDTGRTLTLDTSTPWKAQMKLGDIIQRKIGNNWKDCVFIKEFPNKNALIYTDSLDSFNNGDIDEEEDFSISSKDRWRRKPTEADIEITVKINGKFVSIKDISEETLLKIRNSK